MRNVTTSDVISFVKNQIFHRFRLLESITTDRGSVFVSQEMKEFATDYGVKLLHCLIMLHC